VYLWYSSQGNQGKAQWTEFGDTGQKACISDIILLILPTLGSGTQIGFVVFVVHWPR